MSSYRAEWLDNINWIQEHSYLLSDEDYEIYSNLDDNFSISKDFANLVKLRTKYNGDYKVKKEKERYTNAQVERINKEILSKSLFKLGIEAYNLAVERYKDSKRSKDIQNSVCRLSIVNDIDFAKWCIKASSFENR